MVTYNKGPRQSPFRPRGSGVGNDKGRKAGAKGTKGSRVTMEIEYNRAKKARYMEKLKSLPYSQLTLERKKRSEYMARYRAIQRKKLLTKRNKELDQRVKGFEMSQKDMSTPEREKTLRRHMSEEDASSLTEKKSTVAPRS